MGKVIKILVNTLSVVILTVLGTLVLATVLLDMPSFQNFAVGRATKFISEKLGTRVEIGRLRLKLISRLEIERLYVEDLHGDTLAYIGRLEAGIRDLGLAGGGLSLGEVALEQTRFYMRQTDSTANATNSTLGELLDKLKSDKPKEKSEKPFTLRVASVRIDDLKYRYRKIAPEARDYGVNFQDIDIRRLDLHGEELLIVGDSISLRAKHIAMSDHSGLRVDEMSAAFLAVSGHGLRFKELHIATPDSEVKMNYLNLVSESWQSFGDFIHQVHFEGDLVDSRISYATIAYFAPGLREWQSVYRNLSGHFSGTVADMEGTIDRVAVLDTRLQGVRFDIAGLPDVPNTRFRFEIGSLHTSAPDALWIMHDITRRELPENTRDMLAKLGEVGFMGHFDGRLTKFSANGNLTTGLGGTTVDVAFVPQAKGLTGFDGHLDVQGFDLGALLDSKSLGRASVNGRVQGTLGGETIALDANARLGQLEFNGYTYRGIDMRGRFENRNFEGRIHSSDPNIAFDFDGMLDFNDSIPRYDFDLQLRNADLRRLNFNKRDSLSRLSCRITAQASGNTLDNVNGHADIRDLLYISPTDSVRTGLIRLTGVNNPSGKLLALQSSFAEVQFQSRLGYADLFSYLTGTLQYYIPTLSGDKQIHQTKAKEVIDANDYYLLTLKVKQANNVAGIFVPGLIIANGTELSFMLNPKAEKFSLMLQSEYLEWKRFFVSNLSLNSRNQGDSLSLYLRSDDLFASGFYMPEFSVIGGVKDDRVNLAAHFADKKNHVSALVGATARFTKTPAGMQQIIMRLGQSYITNKDQTWRLSSGEVVYDSTRMDIERLRIVSSNGELTASGALSRSRRDTLRVRLNNFNLQPFTQFTQRMGYSLSGVTNGYADMVSVMKDGMITSNIRFDSLRVNHVAVPPLLFDARWDFHQERARAMITNRTSADTLVQFFYRPGDKRYMGEVSLRGLDLSLIDPLLQGVLKNSRGSADVDMRVSRRADGTPGFNGTVGIQALTTTVDFTNVAYTLKDTRVEVKNNTFALRGARLTDPEGNGAAFDAQFSLAGKDFSNYSYVLGIKPEKLLVLGTTAKDNDLFHGRVHASGAATIRGDKRGVEMDIAATTAENSSFQMSLSSKSGISDVDFITFVTPSAQTDSSFYQQRKRDILAGPEKAGKQNASQLAINMALTVLPNTDFQLVIDPTMGKGIKARGNGALNITVNPKNGDFRMYGDYELTEGSYNLNLERLVDRTFTIQPGSTIRWTGDPADATLDVTASYRLKPSLAPLTGIDSPYAKMNVTVDCKVILTDRLSNPTKDFRVDLPDALPEIQSIVDNSLNTKEAMSTQFLWLVALGSFSGSSGVGNIGTMGGGTAWDFLTSQVSNMISSDKFNIGIKYRPMDDTNSSELDIDFSTRLGSDRVFLDIEGNYNFDNNAATANPDANNLTGDFALRYLIDRTGNTQAKIFSRTINSYDENQGLQESGVGIYYHEDFNTLRDIGRNIRSRFKRANRKAKNEQIQQDTTKRSNK